MELSTSDLKPGMLGAIVTPRPVAWVSTVDAAGRVNLAPFSYFNLVADSPPMVVFAPVRRPDGSKKDTLLNLEAVPEFVLNLVTESTVVACNESSRTLPHGESELDHAGLTAAPSVAVRPPRVAESPVHLECRVVQLMPFGDHPGATTLVLGEIVRIHIDDAVMTDGRVDAAKVKTVGRLAGTTWCHTTDTFSLDRPA